MNFHGLWEKRKDEIIIFLFFILPVIYFFSLLTPRKMIYGSDWLMTGYPRLKWIFDYIKLNHRIPMWDPCIFCGHPTIAATGGGIVYPLNFIYFIFPVHVGRTIQFIIHIFLAGLGMLLLLREYKLSHLAALIGGISFMFAGQLISTTHGGHLGRMIGAVILPWSFLFLHKALDKKSIIYFLVFGGVTGIFLLGGHVQITYWAMIGVFFYFVYEISRRKKEIELKEWSKLFTFSVMGAILASFIVAVKLLPPVFSLEYGARGVTRGYEYATSWSIPSSELFDLIVPHFSGILNNYWGENYFRLDSRYLGILPLILFGLAFLYKRKKYLIRYFAWFTGITLLLALGKNTPLFRLYYWLVPMASKFRAPSMFFFLATFSVCVLVGFGAQVAIDLAERKDEETEKKAFIFLVSTVGVILLATIIVNLGDASILQSMKSHFANEWMGIMSRGVIQQKIQLMGQNFDNFKKSLWISSFLFMINGGLILAVIKRKLDLKIAIPILALVLLVDQWSIDRKYLSSVAAPSKYYEADGVTKYIDRNNGLFRVCPDRYERGNSGYLQYNNIQTVSGLGANPPKRYQDFIGAGRSVMFTTKNFLKYPHLLSMLNVKYIIGLNLPEDLSGYNIQVKKIVEELRDFFSNFNVVFRDREYQVLENESFLPRFSLIYNCSVVDSAGGGLNRILSQEFNTGKVVLLEDSQKFAISEGKGEINIVGNIANERVLDVTTDKNAFLIVRENSHPDWKCYIDGKNEKIYKANYIFYGVFVPAGEHTVRFVYESKVFNFTALISFLGFLIFIVSLMIVYFKKTKDRVD